MRDWLQRWMFLCFYSNLLHMDERLLICQENIAKTYSKADIVFLKCKIHTHTLMSLSWKGMYDFAVILFNLDSIVRGASCHHMHVTAYTWAQLVFNTIWPMVMGLLDPCLEFTGIMCWNPKNVLRGKGRGEEKQWEGAGLQTLPQFVMPYSLLFIEHFWWWVSCRKRSSDGILCTFSKRKWLKCVANNICFFFHTLCFFEKN